MTLSTRFYSFIKLFFLNFFFLGTGYLYLARYYRYFFFLCLFFIACLTIVFGIPYDEYVYIPYYLFGAFFALLLADALLLTIRVAPEKMVMRSKKPFIYMTPLFFIIQWFLVVFIHSPNYATTQIILASSPNMLPQIKMNDMVAARGWAWREKKLGEVGLRRGDIVSYKYGEGNAMVRRIVALPGETMTLQDGIVVINGNAFSSKETGEYNVPMGNGETIKGVLRSEIMPDGRTYEIITKSHLGEKNKADAVYTIPEGFIGVMSDNRPAKLTEGIRDIMVIPVNSAISRPVMIIAREDGTKVKKLIK